MRPEPPAPATSPSPVASPHPVFRDSAEARRFVEQTADRESRARWGKAVADVLLGRALAKVRDGHPFPDEHHGSFEAWAEDRLGYRQVQRDRLLSAGRLDPALVEDRRISRQKLALVGSQPPWLHATLIDLCAGTKEGGLAWAGASAVLHLSQHGEKDAALEHARAVAAGAEAPLVKEPRRDSLGAVLHRFSTSTRRVLEQSAKLLTRTSGQPLPEGSKEAEELKAILLAMGPTLNVLWRLAGLPPSIEIPIGLEEADSPIGLKRKARPSQERRAQDRADGPDPEEGHERDPAPAPAAASKEPEPVPPPPYAPPPRPCFDPHGEAVLPVYAHPSLIEDLTRAERLSCRIFSLADSLTGLWTEFLHLRWKEHEETFLDLQLLAYRELQDTREVLLPLLPLLAPAIDDARATADGEAADPADPGDPADLLLEWILHDNYDPLHEPDPNPSERLLWTVLGQLPIFNQDLGELLALRERGGEAAAIDHRLLRRFGDLLPPLRHLFLKISGNLSVGAGKAYKAQQAEAAQLAALELLRGPREARILVVGADALPPAHGIIGKTLDDNLVTFSFWEPSLTLLLGDRGKGKSHFIRVLIELMTLRPDGLAYLSRPQCPILIDAECTQGEGRFEMLEGFFANHDAAQLHQLHEFYKTEAKNLAFTRAVLLCHREQVARYRELLAPYVERGLCIAPLALGIPDLGGFAFEVMLEWAVGGDQRAVYKNLIQSLVAKEGDRLTLSLLSQAVQRSSLRGTTKQAVLELFELLAGMYTETESVMQHVGEHPVFTLLRGRYLPKNFVNPMQAVLFNAFCRSTENGDPPRVVIFEEFAKAVSGNQAMQRFGMNFAEELRHRPVSAVGGLQHLERFPKGLWGAADNHVVFGLSNPQDVRKAKAELYGMRALRFREMEARQMPTGRARIFSRRGSSPELSRGLLVDIRPTLIRAGGRTLNAGDWQGEP